MAARRQYSFQTQELCFGRAAGRWTHWFYKTICLCVCFQNTVGTYFGNNRVDIAPTYEGRASLDVDMEQKVSTLRLTKVKMEDSRRFQCSVTIPNDDEGITRASASLLVLGENELLFNTFWIAVYLYSTTCHNEDAKFIRLVGPLVVITTFYINNLVVVPPSPPVCTIQGRTEYWKNITITCKSEAGSPKPVTKWNIYSVENVPRQLPPKATDSMHHYSWHPLNACISFKEVHLNIISLLSLFCRGWSIISF